MVDSFDSLRIQDGAQEVNALTDQCCLSMGFRGSGTIRRFSWLRSLGMTGLKMPYYAMMDLP